MRAREALTIERRPVERREHGPPCTDSTILALQRSAGNAAVSGWLARAPSGAQQGNRGLPAEPRSLSDVTAVAKDMTIADDVVHLRGLGQFFGQGGGKARPGISATVRFPGDMAKKGADAKTQQKVREGLDNLAMAIFRLNDAATGDPIADVTRIEEFDLRPFDGQDGRYRFTSVARKWVMQGGRRWPAEVDVIVELLGPNRADLQPWSALSRGRRLDLENRFFAFGFTQAQPGLNKPVVDTWSDDQFGKVLQALEYVPDDILRSVSGILWERGHGGRAPNGEAGLYETRIGISKTATPVRHLTIYDDAFNSDDALIRLIAHEIGHAVSSKPAETGGAAAAVALSADYQSTALADSPTAITTYGKQDWHEHYAESYMMFIAEPDTMKILRPKLFAWFTKQQAVAAPPKPAPAKPPAKAPVPAGTRP